jgi:hypothetical protein
MSQTEKCCLAMQGRSGKLLPWYIVALVLNACVCECVYDNGDSTLSPGEAHSGLLKFAEAIFSFSSVSISHLLSLSSEAQLFREGKPKTRPNHPRATATAA